MARAEEHAVGEIGLAAGRPGVLVVGLRPGSGDVAALRAAAWSRIARSLRWAGVNSRVRRPRSITSDLPASTAGSTPVLHARRRTAPTDSRSPEVRVPVPTPATRLAWSIVATAATVPPPWRGRSSGLRVSIRSQNASHSCRRRGNECRDPGRPVRLRPHGQSGRLVCRRLQGFDPALLLGLSDLRRDHLEDVLR
jgi:hypothetical protein